MNSRWTRGFTGAVAMLSIGFANACRAADEVAVKPTEKTETVAKAASSFDNIKVAFVVESQNKACYEAYAAKATEEGYKSVAVLFRAAAASFTV